MEKIFGRKFINKKSIEIFNIGDMIIGGFRCNYLKSFNVEH